MIPGFEDFTFELTEEEKDIAGALADMFKEAVGPEKAIKSSDIVKRFSGSGIRMSGARVRKMVQYIRVKDLCSADLIATSKGYYVAESDEAFDLYIDGLRGRIRSEQFTLACMTTHHTKRKADEKYK